MHSKSLPGLEGKARKDSLTGNLGDPIGLFPWEIVSEDKAERRTRDEATEGGNT